MALVSVKEEEYPTDLSPSNFPLPGPGTRGLQHGRNTNNRLSPSHSRGPSPRTVSPSAIHITNDQSFQSHSTLGSTPATPTIPVTTQNHLLQMYQQQQQQQPPQIIGNQQQHSRSQSNQHTDLSNVNTHYVHKVLTQQLREHHLLKQSLVNQMKNPQSPKHQQILTIRLNQVNTSILLVNQHLVMTSQLAYQQQQRGNSDGNSDGTSDGIGSNEHVPISKTLSPPEVFGMDGHNSSDINSSMQNMSLSQSNTVTSNTSVDQQPVRTISKLQRIISSSSHDNKPIDSFANISDEHSVFEEEHQGINMPIPNPIGLPNPGYNTVTSSNSNISDYPINSNVQSAYFTNTSQHQPIQPPLSSSPLTSSGKFSRSVDEIPEFKPGVPWNPSLSSITSANPSFNNTRKVRSDSHRPDSIQLSTGNGPYSNNDRPNFLEPKSEIEFYRDPKSSYSNPHMSSQPYHRPGSSPGIAPGNPRYGGNGNYSSTPTGGYNPGGYYNRPPTVHGFPPTRPSPSTPSQMFPPNQFNGGRNRQRLYSQQSGPAGYNDLGQRNRGYDVGRKWSFDGNPWGVPEKSGNYIMYMYA